MDFASGLAYNLANDPLHSIVRVRSHDVLDIADVAGIQPSLEKLNFWGFPCRKLPRVGSLLLFHMRPTLQTATLKPQIPCPY